MFRQLIILSGLSIVAFCFISFITVVVSLLSTVGQPQLKPTINIGFPFKYYYQFWVSGNDFPNYGWNINDFVLDALFAFLITTGIYLITVRKNKLNKKGE